MEYDKAIQSIGEFGKYQKLVLALLALPIMLDAPTTYIFSFSLGNHLHSIGRRKTLIGTVFILFISNFLTPWMPNVYLAAVCQTFNAIGSTGTYMTTIVLGTELVGPSKRVLVSFIMYFAFCIGEYLLLLEAYFIRDVNHLFLAISLPVAPCILLFLFFIPESPRWLLTCGKVEEAKTILNKIATVNNCKLDNFEDELIVSQNPDYSYLVTVKKVFSSRVMVKRFLILSISWISIVLTYYAIGLNIGDFGGNVYTNFAIASLAELAAITTSYWSDRFARKKFFCFSMLLGSISCLSTFFTSYFGGDSLDWCTIALAMIGKFGATLGFFIVYLITAELFPTVMRTSILAICNAVGKIGGLVSPYIGKLGVYFDTRFGIALPFIVVGMVGFVAGILDLFLPETRKNPLPNNFKDAMELKDKKSTQEGNE